MLQGNSRYTGIYPPYHIKPHVEMGYLGLFPKDHEQGYNWDDEVLSWDSGLIWF